MKLATIDVFYDNVGSVFANETHSEYMVMRQGAKSFYTENPESFAKLDKAYRSILVMIETDGNRTTITIQMDEDFDSVYTYEKGELVMHSTVPRKKIIAKKRPRREYL